LIGRTGDWQTILLGDMCYERPLAERLLVCLKNAGAPARRCCWAIRAELFSEIGVEKLATYRVQTTRELEDREIRETSVYRLL